MKHTIPEVIGPNKWKLKDKKKLAVTIGDWRFSKGRDSKKGDNTSVKVT